MVFEQNVRVIQRNLVYVVGLSMNLCREDVLRKQDFFGQFGKIVKVEGVVYYASLASPASLHNVMWSPPMDATIAFVSSG